MFNPEFQILVEELSSSERNALKRAKLFQKGNFLVALTNNHIYWVDPIEWGDICQSAKAGLAKYNNSEGNKLWLVAIPEREVI